MLIFNKGQLWIVEWARKFNAALGYQTVTNIPAIIKKNDIIYVSDHSVSNILHHIDNCRNRGYTPLQPIFEIYSDGSILRRSEAGGGNKSLYMHTHALDPMALTVIGPGGRAFIASLELVDGDVMAALRNTTNVASHIKMGARVTQYNLPTPQVEFVQPDGDFILE